MEPNGNRIKNRLQPITMHMVQGGSRVTTEGRRKEKNE